tara:strand:+ start:663 stop:1658 length:996 start_codon:yes stop_codon:yes gene_type:complete
MQNMAQMGRFGDTSMAHVSPGVMVVPKEILDRQPNLQRGIMGAIAQEGMDPRRYTVGAPQNSINPMTGQPEYFNLKKLLKFAAPFVLGPAVGSLLGTAATGATASGLLGGLGKFAPQLANFLSNPIAKGALGAAGTSALTGGKKKDILRSALLGGLGGYTFKEGAPGFMKAPEGTDLSAVKADNFLTKAIKTVAPESTFVGSKMFNLMNNPIGLAATLGITAEAFAAMSPEEKEEAIRKYAFGTTDKFNPLIDFSAQKARPMNKGGATSFPRRDGGIMPSEGSGTKDDVPAMLTAGEFVLTRDAVKGLGNGNLNSGIQKAYTMMNKLERMA